MANRRFIRFYLNVLLSIILFSQGDNFTLNLFRDIIDVNGDSWPAQILVIVNFESEKLIAS